MSLWRKKPVVIEAFRWAGDLDEMENPEWFCQAMRDGMVIPGTSQAALLIETLEGTHRANRGDWIIRGIKGEIYPCKPDIFEMTYDPA